MARKKGKEGTCYWQHVTSEKDTYNCFDGENRVCARCCVEACAKETPDYFKRCAQAGHPTWPAVIGSRNIASKLICLESYWDDELFHTLSVRPFLDALSPLITPPLQLAHRFVESKKGLAYYTKYPNGILWTAQETWDSPIYYLAFHGAPGSVKSVLDSVGTETLCNAFKDFGKCGHDVLIYFGACSVFRGRSGEIFANEFLRSSGCAALVGYKTDVAWMESLVTDLLFLSRFYNNVDPWHNIENIFFSVQKDFAPSQKLGLTILINEEWIKRK